MNFRGDRDDDYLDHEADCVCFFDELSIDDVSLCSLRRWTVRVVNEEEETLV